MSFKNKDKKNLKINLIKHKIIALTFPTQQPIIKRMMKTAHKPPTLCAPTRTKTINNRNKTKIIAYTICLKCFSKFFIYLSYDFLKYKKKK